ncbi:MAG: hypothetical protein HFI93_11625 [Lachnospiraceae bacterium]|nr:hypothetical protein [Lachnospiraceae bacterium]
MKKKNIFPVVFCLILFLGAISVGGVLLENRGMAAPVSLYWKSYANFIPFATFGSYVTRIWDGTIRTAYFWRFLASTFLLFLGVGYFARIRWEKKVILCAAAAFCVAKELIQGLTRLGSCDINAVIFLMLGCLLGMWICEGAARKGNRKRSAGI